MPSAVVGEVLADRYELLEALGEGSFGEVWRAHDRHRDHQVALKLLKSRDRAAAWTEAAVLTAMRSEHILEVNNADLIVDLPYLDTALAMTSLDKACGKYGTEPRQAVGWIRRALRGLELCHQRGLLHRDVKPANVFLTHSGDARLGDFGIARVMDQDASAEPGGDPHIQAPEFFAGKRATVASDIYAVGVTLYYLLAGRWPFERKMQDDLVAAITAGDCVSLRDVAPHVSKGLADRVRRGMALNPADRYPSAAAFDSALGQLPRQVRIFDPALSHEAHARCWSATGRGSPLTVCLISDSDRGGWLIETRRANGGNRRTDCCMEATDRTAPGQLRKVFDRLRAG